MQSTSQTWRDLFAAGAALQARATVGGVAYTDISAPVINRALMQDRLSVGNVVSASLALAVRGAVNIPRSAAVAVEVRLNDGQTASEWLPQGTFYISRRMRDPVTGLLALECYDALLKTNAVWVPSAGAWPRTLAAVTAELAALLGVTLDGRTVIPTGAAYAMSEPAEGMTIRDALSVIAQAAGGNWIMTPGNKLRLVRLGESGGTADVIGVTGGIDVGQAGTVTGVRSTVDGVVTLIGDDTGIVVDVAVAPVIAAEMAENLIGQTYAPFRLTGAIYDPAAELGDGVRAGAGGEVVSALCSEQAVYGPAFRGDIAAPDPGELTDEYPYIGSADKTLALAKAAVTEAVGALDDELTQQEIFNRLTDNGAAQGIILYNEQLYINASYINAGFLNVGRINFNEPDSYYDVPNENDPDSLLSGQTVVDDWIVNASGTGKITVFFCGFAIPLRGKTITVTFTYNGSLSGGTESWTSISSTAQQFTNEQNWITPSGQTIPNPYTRTVTVPDDAMFFQIAVACSGVKLIGVSLSSPVTPSDSIEYNYEGQQIGDATKFRVYRDGTLITYAKSIFNGVTRMSRLYLNAPLDVNAGGTGATTAANARTKLGITPANIGAVAKSGDTINGTLTVNNDSYSNNGFVRFWKDGEGGNIVIASPNGKEFQIDASNNNRIRFFAYDDDGNYKAFEFNRITGVVSASGGFDGTVKKSGDTMTGPLKWSSGTALPAASSLQYFLGIDPFADGGTTHYITAANLLAAIGAAKAPTLISSSVGTAASIALDLSAYWRIEMDFCAASKFGHLVMTEKNQWYYVSYLSDGAASATDFNMFAIKAKYTDTGITIDYCGYKNLSTGAWNDRIGNPGYLLRNIYGYA